MMSIIYQTDLEGINSTRELYKKPIYFFSEFEKKRLLAVHELFEDSELFFAETYKPRKRQDTFTMVYEGSKPSYHEDFNCNRLKSDYENFKIPPDIIRKGEATVLEFREWFKEVEHLQKDAPDIFVARLRMRWGITTNVQAINIGNSGAVEMENRAMPEIEEAIDRQIKEAGRFYYQSEKNTEILKSFSRKTYMAYKEEMWGNYTSYSDDEVRELLKEYDERFKKPLSQNLIHYYRMKLNPELKMEGRLLEELGFNPCGNCANSRGVSKKNSNVLDDDDLPF